MIRGKSAGNSVSTQGTQVKTYTQNSRNSAGSTPRATPRSAIVLNFQLYSDLPWGIAEGTARVVSVLLISVGEWELITSTRGALLVTFSIGRLLKLLPAYEPQKFIASIHLGFSLTYPQPKLPRAASTYAWFLDRYSTAPTPQIL